jgi:hypothetical protein
MKFKVGDKVGMEIQNLGIYYKVCKMDTCMNGIVISNKEYSENGLYFL